ncbi:flagellar hook-associated protein FlgK [Cobetia sp. 14N.309.X.WAT.E.A4]|uniref:Flagellar hook-associated protein 1 n=1 Tax=Cobetia marina TaxID=28258 RepID=A0ABU9GAB9_COBMA|nr:flagellar hook-associated protein FlgK [Cobetia sp. 14N.309.X.WAT.E.A4]MDN2656014.1 flagellar hook-associated protein FlgK [Cobetia sp. 14N.309.X.WAT.E.A4]
MASSMLSIGVSGLQAAQTALATNSNNIANVYTPGYSRETVELSGGPGASPVSGVSVSSISRQTDAYLSAQLDSALSASAALETREANLSQIDNLLADEEAGLAPLMQQFFAAIEGVASQPGDPAARESMLGTAESLAGQLNAFAGYLDEMDAGVNARIGDVVGDINNATTQIASLNEQISMTRARTGEEPLGLLDQRDQAVTELQSLVGVDVQEQDGRLSISLGNGQLLVNGSDSHDLVAVVDPQDASRVVVNYSAAPGMPMSLEEGQLEGGTLGGLLGFREESLAPAQNQLGQLAAGLALTFNAQHGDGIDANGDAGGDFFTLGTPEVLPASGNTLDAALEVEFAPATLKEGEDFYSVALTGDDYRLSLEGGEYRLENLGNGTVESLSPDSEGLMQHEGLILSATNMQEGDSFTIQPTRQIAATFGVAIDDGADIAAGESSGSLDNRNILALQQLQSSDALGSAGSFNDQYASLVSQVGNQTRLVQVNLEAQQSLTEQLTAAEQSVSGVNLDEEAADLIRYQQFYQANAQVIQTAATVLDTLLNIR